MAGVATGYDLIEGTCILHPQASVHRKTFTLNLLKCQKARPHPHYEQADSQGRLVLCDLIYRKNR